MRKTGKALSKRLVIVVFNGIGIGLKYEIQKFSCSFCVVGGTKRQSGGCACVYVSESIQSGAVWSRNAE